MANCHRFDFMRHQLLNAITRLVVPNLKLKHPPSKEVAILVPVSDRCALTNEEEISKRQLFHYLGEYDKFLIAPEGFKLRLDGFHVKYFKREYFGSAAAHGRLLNHPSFYREFQDYEFVFFYHLDSLAFSNQLRDWCRCGLDYVGPPWIPCDDSPWVKEARVGNGGFALLRVQSALKVFEMRYRKEPLTYWLDLFSRNSPDWVIQVLRKYQTLYPGSKIVHRLLKEWDEISDPSPHDRNNDIFWSDFASYYHPEFKVASVKEGLQFAFEVSPRTCFELNNRCLPFGCHAWAKYDRAFWEPYLVNETSESGLGSAGCGNGSSLGGWL